MSRYPQYRLSDRDHFERRVSHSPYEGRIPSREQSGWTPYPQGDVRRGDRSSSMPRHGDQYWPDKDRTRRRQQIGTRPYRPGTPMYNDFEFYKGEDDRFNESSKHYNYMKDAWDRRNQDNAPYEARGPTYYGKRNYQTTAHNQRSLQYMSENNARLARSVRDRRQDFIERHPGRAYAHHKAYIGHRKQIDQLDRAAIAAENDAMNHFVHARRGGYY